MTRHTPGPWMVSPWDAQRIFQNNSAMRSHIEWDNYERHDFEEPPTPEANEKDLVLVCEIYYENEREEADASLIAAAPELLEALRPFAELAKELPTGPDWQDDNKFVWGFNSADVVLGDFRRVTAAIAKAENRESLERVQ